MIGIDLKPELQELVDNIARKNMYSGNKIPESIMKMFSIEITELHDGILVPYWLGVLERGRGPRKSSVDSGLYLKIKRWMRKRNMFKSKTAKGQDNEAKQLTWYINHWGNKQFNKGNPIFVDIYNKERKITIDKINKKFSDKISKITMEVL
jgi:hypothetical protein